MQNVYCRVRKATTPWLMEKSASGRIFANNHGDYCELNSLSEPYMFEVAIKMILKGELFVLTSINSLPEPPEE